MKLFSIERYRFARQEYKWGILMSLTLATPLELWLAAGVLIGVLLAFILPASPVPACL